MTSQQLSKKKKTHHLLGTDVTVGHLGFDLSGTEVLTSSLWVFMSWILDFLFFIFFTHLFHMFKDNTLAC